MIDLMKGMENTRDSTGKESLNGEGSNNAEGSQSHTDEKNQSHATSEVPKIQYASVCT